MSTSIAFDASLEDDEDAEALPSCSVCLHTYNGSWHRPYDLGCGHCLCQRCYVNWSGRKLCPACRKDWRSPHIAFDFLGALEVILKQQRELRNAAAMQAASAMHEGPAPAPSATTCNAAEGTLPPLLVPLAHMQQQPASPLYALLRQQQRASHHAASTSLAGRIRRRLGLAGLGEAEMSLRELLHHAALSHNVPPWAVALTKTLGPGALLLLVALAWRYVYAVALVAIPVVVTAAAYVDHEDISDEGGEAEDSAGLGQRAENLVRAAGQQTDSTHRRLHQLQRQQQPQRQPPQPQHRVQQQQDQPQQQTLLQQLGQEQQERPEVVPLEQQQMGQEQQQRPEVAPLLPEQQPQLVAAHVVEQVEQLLQQEEQGQEQMQQNSAAVNMLLLQQYRREVRASRRRKKRRYSGPNHAWAEDAIAGSEDEDEDEEVDYEEADEAVDEEEEEQEEEEEEGMEEAEEVEGVVEEEQATRSRNAAVAGADLMMRLTNLLQLESFSNVNLNTNGELAQVHVQQGQCAAVQVDLHQAELDLTDLLGLVTNELATARGVMPEGGPEECTSASDMPDAVSNLAELAQAAKLPPEMLRSAAAESSPAPAALGAASCSTTQPLHAASAAAIPAAAVARNRRHSGPLVLPSSLPSTDSCTSGIITRKRGNCPPGTSSSCPSPATAATAAGHIAAATATAATAAGYSVTVATATTAAGHIAATAAIAAGYSGTVATATTAVGHTAATAATAAGYSGTAATATAATAAGSGDTSSLSRVDKESPQCIPDGGSAVAPAPVAPCAASALPMEPAGKPGSASVAELAVTSLASLPGDRSTLGPSSSSSAPPGSSSPSVMFPFPIPRSAPVAVPVSRPGVFRSTRSTHVMRHEPAAGAGSTAGPGTPNPSSTAGPGTPKPSSTAGPGTPNPTSTAGPGTPNPTSTAGPGTPNPSSTAGPRTPNPGSTAGPGEPDLGPSAVPVCLGNPSSSGPSPPAAGSASATTAMPAAGPQPSSAPSVGVRRSPPAGTHPLPAADTSGSPTGRLFVSAALVSSIPSVFTALGLLWHCLILQRVLLWLMLGGLLLWMAEAAWQLIVGQPAPTLLQMPPGAPSAMAAAASNTAGAAPPLSAAAHSRRKQRVMRVLRWSSYLALLLCLAAWVFYERMPLMMLLARWGRDGRAAGSGNAGGAPGMRAELTAGSRRPSLSASLAALTMARVCVPPVAFFILQATLKGTVHREIAHSCLLRASILLGIGACLGVARAITVFQAVQAAITVYTFDSRMTEGLLASLRQQPVMLVLVDSNIEAMSKVLNAWTQTNILLWILLVPPMSSLLRVPPLSLLSGWAHLGLLVWPALAVVHILGAADSQALSAVGRRWDVLGASRTTDMQHLVAVEMSVLICKCLVLAIPLVAWLLAAALHPMAAGVMWGVLAYCLFALDLVLLYRPALVPVLMTKLQGTFACMLLAPQAMQVHLHMQQGEYESDSNEEEEEEVEAEQEEAQSTEPNASLGEAAAMTERPAMVLQLSPRIQIQMPESVSAAVAVMRGRMEAEWVQALEAQEQRQITDLPVAPGAGVGAEGSEVG